MKIPSFCCRIIGTQPGPSVAILGGTHGDELTGIEVVKHFLHTFGIEDCSRGIEVSKEIKGELLLIFGNPKAIALRQRGTTEGRDLNRYFIDEDLQREPSTEDPYDLVRARELAPLLASADFVFDIHATSAESPPFIVCGNDSSKHREIFQIFPVEYILMDLYNVLAMDEGLKHRATADAYVEQCGGVAIGYETGKEDDLSRVIDIVQEMNRALQHVGIFEREAIKIHETVSQQLYTLTHSIQAKDSYFKYVQGMDSGWQLVQKGQIIGHYLNGENECAPEQGMLLFPKSPHKIKKDKNLYYIAKPVI